MFFSVFLSITCSDVLLLRHCVNTHLDGPDKQTAKASAILEVVTFAVDQLLK